MYGNIGNYKKLDMNKLNHFITSRICLNLSSIKFKYSKKKNVLLIALRIMFLFDLDLNEYLKVMILNF